MSSSAARKGMVSRRYQFAKLFVAAEEALHAVMSPQTASPSSSGESILSRAITKFQEAYTKQMTTTMYIAGTAMCPSLNSAALTDSGAIEKLVVRQLPRASSRSVWVGDVVAFSSPLAKAGDAASSVLVRRVAAVEGMEMVAEAPSSSAPSQQAAQPDEDDDQDDGDDFVIPAGNCWVLADNAELSPPDVIDSRSFGFIPMSNILGRVVYAGHGPSAHGPVTNSPLAQIADEPVLAQEVDPEVLFQDSGDDATDERKEDRDEGGGRQDNK